MGQWVNPDETDPRTWRGEEPHGAVRHGEDILSVVERADKTGLPYQYEEDVHYTDDVAAFFRTRTYTNARVVYNCGVDANRRVKLLTRGLLWGGDDREQRFQAQYRRSPPPTDTVPFAEYTVWTRYQFGTIERTESGVTFRADDGGPEERLRTLAWSELYEPIRGRIAELELVRNPTFARYRLLELDEWDDYRAQFAYDEDAFALGP